MSIPFEVTESTGVATVTGVSSGDLGHVTVTLVFYSAQGTRRHFVQQVPVKDEGLARRALTEIHQGDRVDVRVINEWRVDGCNTYLADYKRLAETKAETATTNGSMGVVHNGLTDAPTRRAQRTKHQTEVEEK